MCKPAMAHQHTMHRHERIQVPRVPDMLGRRNLSTNFHLCNLGHWNILELGCFHPTMLHLHILDLSSSFWNRILPMLFSFVHKQTQPQAHTSAKDLATSHCFNDCTITLPSFRPFACRTGRWNSGPRNPHMVIHLRRWCPNCWTRIWACTHVNQVLPTISLF